MSCLSEPRTAKKVGNEEKQLKVCTAYRFFFFGAMTGGEKSRPV